MYIYKVLAIARVPPVPCIARDLSGRHCNLGGRGRQLLSSVDTVQIHTSFASPHLGRAFLL